jgi:hypothetical protein
LTAHLDERTKLVLTILERTLLVRARDQVQMLRDPLPVIMRARMANKVSPQSIDMPPSYRYLG